MFYITKLINPNILFIKKKLIYNFLVKINKIMFIKLEFKLFQNVKKKFIYPVYILKRLLFKIFD